MGGANNQGAQGGQAMGRPMWGAFGSGMAGGASGAAGAPGWRRDADAQRAPQGDSASHDEYGAAYGPQGEQADDAYIHALTSPFAEGAAADVNDGDDDGDLALGDAPAGMASGALLGETQRRTQTRQLIREFLRAVPRGEPETALSFLGMDGEAHTVTRAQMSAAIDRLRPRQRQIMRLGVEERRPRQEVCAYLRNISIKTFERDQVEALDILSQL